MQGVIVSDPKEGIPSFGLVEEGKKQAKDVSNKLSHVCRLHHYATSFIGCPKTL